MPQVIRHTKNPEVEKIKREIQKLKEERNEKKVISEGDDKENREERDLFICHATEDKEIVRPLVEALIDAGFSVWYDEFALKIGDRLRRSMDKGLAQSRYGLVVLSPNFFAKEWPQKELDGLAAKERDGKKVILPVWHNVDEEYVRQKSPILSGILAVSTTRGIDCIVREVLREVKPSKTLQLEARARALGKAEEESTRRRLERAIHYVKGQDEKSVTAIVKEMTFKDLKQMFLDVLDGVAFFDLSDSHNNKGIFNFISSAILERNRKEGAELFEALLRWFFQTATPNCREAILEIFARLTRLSHLKKVISKTDMVSSFVAEFGASDSYRIAGFNTEILQNIKLFLSETDCGKIVDFALSNDQILDSWVAHRYLMKILSSCEGKVDPAIIAELYQELDQRM